MKHYNSYLVILIILMTIIFVQNDPLEEEEEEWKSPCERTKKPNSIEDCTGKSTEFVDETCCFLKGKQFGGDMLECVEVIRDDVRTKELINNTVRNIIQGTYWEPDVYNLTYDSIEEFRCSNKYIVQQMILIILMLLIFLF